MEGFKKVFAAEIEVLKKELEKLFDQGDTGKTDNQLTRSEFTHRLENAHGGGKFTDMIHEAGLMRFFDLDGDGKFNFSELLKLADARTFDALCIFSPHVWGGLALPFCFFWQTSTKEK